MESTSIVAILLHCPIYLAVEAWRMYRWNGASEDQAADRCHRLGQTRPVQVNALMLSVARLAHKECPKASGHVPQL